ncbi:stage II sporulation protein M [Salibacterium halotolerans]|uniref:Stage II sporulation protein M n=1 Tax=Salibacterium halotolerans TaxID=1884432 RepID=A0A1I5NSU5_9BACI|nr:stage II sporulation protein M [Salibacterium halotolerans]SFP24885.1 stage II sporulation protein M [Salibacterium halotolerans]
MIESLHEYLRRHWLEYRSLYWFSIVLLFMGVMFGAVLVNSLAMDLKNDLNGFVSQFFSQFREGADMAPHHIFLQSLSRHAGYLILMWVLGLSVAGVPFILILLFLKGVVSGFTIGFLVQQMGSGGFFLAFSSIFLQNVIIIPSYIIMAVISISISLSMIKHLFQRKKSVHVPRVLLKSAAAAGCLLLGICGAAAVEGYVSPVLIKNVLNWVQ